MDGPRFDALTRSLVAPGSRRRFVAGLLALAAAVRGGRVAAAPPEPCPGGHLCSGACCEGGFEACCNHTCVEIVVDLTHCNGCGKTCPDGQLCCGGVCKHPLIDKANCGACGHTCGRHASCRAGGCVCADGYISCHGKCVPSDVHNCGACGHACPTDAYCYRGTCFCNDGELIICDGTCVAHGPHNTSGTATCENLGDVVSTKGHRCPHPQQAECCSASKPGAGDGFAHCCTRSSGGHEGDCVLNEFLDCPNGGVGVISYACHACHACRGDDAYNCVCFHTGEACTADAQCCSGRCTADGRCGCAKNGVVFKCRTAYISDCCSNHESTGCTPCTSDQECTTENTGCVDGVCVRQPQ